MKLKIARLSLFGAGLLMFSAIPYKTLLAETSTHKQSITIAYEYPQNFVKNYLEDCFEQASDHLEAEDARQVCDCTLDKFQTGYNYKEYKELSAESKQDIGLTCFEEMEPEE